MEDGKMLMRARNSAVGGVCAGLAEHFDLDTIVVRILAVLITLLTGPLGIIGYLVLWAAIPLEPQRAIPYDVMPEYAESSTYGNIACKKAASLRAGGTVRAQGAPEDDQVGEGVSIPCRIAIALGLTVLFLALSVNLSPLLPGTRWWQFWPVAPLTLGLCLIVIPVHSRHPSGEAAWHVAGVVMSACSATLLPMALGIVSWHTLPFALDHLWGLLLLAVVLFTFGFARNSLALMMLGAFFVVCFCVLTIFLYAIPGDMEALMTVIPGGRHFVFRGPTMSALWF